ncbi:hypothetical protein [Gluconobacter roseus]|nr:hypothetical protein [Gluconobacter roseus]
MDRGLHRLARPGAGMLEELIAIAIIVVPLFTAITVIMIGAE